MKKKFAIARVTVEIEMNDSVPLDIRTAWALVMPDAIGKLLNDSGANCQIALAADQEECDAITTHLEELGQDFEIVSHDEMEAMSESKSATSH